MSRHRTNFDLKSQDFGYMHLVQYANHRTIRHGSRGTVTKTISTNENNSLHSAPELAELTKCVNIPRKEF